MTLMDLLADVGERYTATYQDKLAKKKPRKKWNTIATQRLYNSVGYIATNDGLEILMADHWQNVEDGRKKMPYLYFNGSRRIKRKGVRGRRPKKSKFIEALRDWIKVRNIRDRRTGVLVSPFAIANGINKKGIKPLKFREQTDNEVLGNLDQLIEDFTNTYF